MNGAVSVLVTNEEAQPLSAVLMQFKAEREWH